MHIKICLTVCSVFSCTTHLSQVSSEEIVQEIRNMLMDTEEQCHRTCFALTLDGNSLDAYTELKNIQGMKEGAEIKVVEGKAAQLAHSAATKSCYIRMFCF